MLAGDRTSKGFKKERENILQGRPNCLGSSGLLYREGEKRMPSLGLLGSDASVQSLVHWVGGINASALLSLSSLL